MGIIQGNSRLSHHTITTAGMTFSVPSQEDFTIRGTSQSWTMASLALSEIGVNEGDKKAYIRIADTINELAFIGGVNGNTLEQVLHYGNNSSTYSIIMGTGTNIRSANGTSRIGLDAFGANTVLIDNAGGLGTDAFLYMNNNTNVLGTSETGTTTLSGGAYNFVNTYGSDTGKRAGIDIKTLSGTYSSVRLNNRQFRYDTYSTSAIGTYSIQTLDFMNDGQTISINVMLNSYTSFPDRNIGVKLFAVFIKYGGTIYQTGTTDNVTKDGYSDGTSATIDTDGTNIYIKFHAGSNIFYDINFAYDYLLS